VLEVNGESGGQMLRSSLGLSALLRKPVTIYNIRAKRPNPGLQAQHLTGLNTLKILSSAKVHGAVKGSMKVVFKPEQFSGGNLNVNIGTAGSVMLLVQAVMLPSMLKETKLRIFGGTDVPFAPSFNYSEKVLFPVLSKMNARFSASLVSRGFYPKGNGSISFKSLPAELPLNPIKLTKKKKVKFVWLFSHSASLPQEVARVQALAAKNTLKELGIEVVERISSKQQGTSIGSAIDLIAKAGPASIGANALGARGKPAEEVGKEAAEKLLKELNSNAAVDSHLSYQLIPFMALAKGKSEILCPELSEHTKNNIAVAEKFLGVKFNSVQENNAVKLWVEGAAFS